MTEEPVPKKVKQELTKEEFERFLSWLSEDRDTAVKEYEKIKDRLVKFFIRKGCSDPHALFDVTIDRVARKIGGAFECPTPIAFCFGVARRVWQEDRRRPSLVSLPPDDFLPVPGSPPEGQERKARCLDECLAKLSESSRDLITRFYQGRGRVKIDARKMLAKEHGGDERLRMNAFRIRRRLRDCIDGCMNRTQ